MMVFHLEQEQDYFPVESGLLRVYTGLLIVHT